jgi:hypothetical protein
MPLQDHHVRGELSGSFLLDSAVAHAQQYAVVGELEGALFAPLDRGE